MPTKTLYSDEDNNEMICYLNDKRNLFISVSRSGENIAYNSLIILNRDDVKQLITTLTELEKEMEY